MENIVVTVSNYATGALQSTLTRYNKAGYKLVTALLAKNQYNVDVMYLFFSADVVPIRHGQWIDKIWTTEDDWSCYNHHVVICSVCNKQFDYVINEKSNYCPSCGAKMDGGQNK